MYLVKTPPLLKTLFSDYTWDLPNENKTVYLTFDDGPIPEATPWILDLLHDYDFRATFFCVGHNVKKYPDIFYRILDEGHNIGNHTFHHLNGWYTPTDEYLQDVMYCDEMMSSGLFRPPYGKLRPQQSANIRATKKIIMWDILSGDFDSTITDEKCLTNVLNNTDVGSIVVFHDSLKTIKRLKQILPVYFEYLKRKGFTSSPIFSLENIEAYQEPLTASIWV